MTKIWGGGEVRGGGPEACSPEKMLKPGPLLKQELEYKHSSLNYFTSFSKREYKNNLFFKFLLDKSVKLHLYEACSHVKCPLLGESPCFFNFFQK